MKEEIFKQDLVQFINGQLVKSKNKKINSQSMLFEDRLIDSLKILNLIAFVEKKLKIKISDKDIIMENFASVDQISEIFLKSSIK